MDAIELACYAMRKDSYIPYDQDFLQSNFILTEDLIIKQNLFEKLSKDSKTAIEIMVNSPQEVVKNMNTLRKYLYLNGVSYRKCTKIFNELKEFVKEITDV